jgi:hypothetical protein
MKRRNNLISIILLFFIIASYSFCQERTNEKLGLTGNLYTDSRIIQSTYSQITINPMADDIPGKKSPVLSGVLSAVVPGAGQVYNGDYWIAGIFVAVEAALITTAVIYDNKGDNQTNFFQNYADDYTNPYHNWSVVKYAQWLNQYHNGEIPINPDESLPPWERVDFNILHQYEIGSHNLYPHGDQQYYEMIGKYHEYAAGWNDFPDNQSSTDPISNNFIYYSGLRGQANDYYNTASTAVVGVYINHLLSAAEAVWGATRFNNNIAVNLRVETQNIAGGIELVPTVKMKFSF